MKYTDIGATDVSRKAISEDKIRHGGLEKNSNLKVRRLGWLSLIKVQIVIVMDGW